MLEIEINETELFDDVTQTFSTIHKQTLHLEHSLLSISKWESKWNKPFLSRESQNKNEFIDYIKCMTLDKKVDSNTYLGLTNDDIVKIQKYIDAPMTATIFYDKGSSNSRNNRKRITSERIYYWMISFNIPFECQKWHLNRLMTLIKLCQIENEPRKKVNPQETANRYAAMNAARRKALNTKG